MGILDVCNLVKRSFEEFEQRVVKAANHTYSRTLEETWTLELLSDPFNLQLSESQLEEIQLRLENRSNVSVEINYKDFHFVNFTV